ncbi:MAG: hypothetical protein QOJ27_1585 [Sphingomonadales bacterium]|nr:hypothetical protein [Sphingomonadales bacterium]
MIRGSVAAVCAASLFLFASSCTTAPAGLVLPRLKAGAQTSGEAARVRGTLVRSGPCLAVTGNGSTVIVWPRSAPAARSGGIGTVVVVWPRQAVARSDGGGTVVVIWPFRRTDPPLRTGEEVQLSGDIITNDNVSGLARIPDDPGCRGDAYLVVREAPPAG